jgi:ABC-type dipeptide/oligopeptide/nickel transport system ATPase component
MPPILEIADLEVTFPTAEGDVSAVRGVNLSVEPGQVLGVVGESGSGKTVTMLATLGLLPGTSRVTGSVRFKGKELLGLAPSELRKVRGSGIAMIFQDARTSLNPVHTIGHQIVEGIRIHHPEVSRKDAAKRAVELLSLVGIPRADKRARDYPHQFSGGMCQRAMIAMAVANNPDVLVADEPTTALDVTIQAQILDLLRDIRREKGVAIVIISHDLGVVAGLADRVAVMYAGRVVERGTVDDVYAEARHPYTRSHPSPGSPTRTGARWSLSAVARRRCSTCRAAVRSIPAAGTSDPIAGSTTRACAGSVRWRPPVTTPRRWAPWRSSHD